MQKFLTPDSQVVSPIREQSVSRQVSLEEDQVAPWLKTYSVSKLSSKKQEL